MASEPVSDELLDELERLSAEADPPPWCSFIEGRDHESGDSFVMVGEGEQRRADLYLSRESAPAGRNDHDLVAAARTYLPALVAEIRRLREPAPNEGVAVTDASSTSGISEEEPWYAVRCHFAMPENSAFTYEERVTLWRAASAERAIERAEEEARSYASSGFGDVQYLENASVFHLFGNEPLVDGLEVFSEMRKSDLGPDEYLERFFFTGNENST